MHMKCDLHQVRIYHIVRIVCVSPSHIKRQSMRSMRCVYSSMMRFAVNVCRPRAAYMICRYMMNMVCALLGMPIGSKRPNATRVQYTWPTLYSIASARGMDTRARYTDPCGHKVLTVLRCEHTVAA